MQSIFLKETSFHNSTNLLIKRQRIGSKTTQRFLTRSRRLDNKGPCCLTMPEDTAVGLKTTISALSLFNCKQINPAFDFLKKCKQIRHRSVIFPNRKIKLSVDVVAYQPNIQSSFWGDFLGEGAGGV